MRKYCIVVLQASLAYASRNVVHERRALGSEDSTPYRRSPANGDALVDVRIALAQSNLDRGYEYVMDVSDPSSVNYGNHWTTEQVEAKFAPAPNTVDLVQDWLSQAGIERAQQSVNQGWLDFEVTVARLEQLLDASYSEFEDGDGNTRLGCDEYSLPEHLIEHIDYITPAIHLGGVVKRNGKAGRRRAELIDRQIDETTDIQEKRTSPGLKNCGAGITPDCLRALYDIPVPGNLSIPRNGLGVFESDSTYLQKDLNLFFAKYAPYVKQGTGPRLVSINDGANGSVAGGEADFDFQIVYGQVGQADITNYQAVSPTKYQGPKDLMDPVFAAVDSSYCTQAMRKDGFQCGGSNLTTVVSISYGLPELVMLPASIQRRACNEFMKHSLKGHTFLVSSGDFGVGNYPIGPPCPSNGCLNRNLTSLRDGPIFVPQFPATCPYVLAVGATQLPVNESVHEPETVLKETDRSNCSPHYIASSGGGFSNYFPRPSYQNTTVNQYLKQHVPKYKSYNSNGVDISSNTTNVGANQGIYNHAGRGIPDVSANGANYVYFTHAFQSTTSGTSLSAPLWASLITMFNAERAAMGKGPVGFVNPVLYQNPQAFNDITKGNNPACGTNGFPAVAGWDPSTGLGTPKYPALLEIFKNLP